MRLAYGGWLGCAEAVARPLFRLLHRPDYSRFREADMPSGGFVLVANHASGTDPPLLQIGVHRPIRFMMAVEQMRWPLGPFWRALRVLPVKFSADDAATLRIAVRHARDGGIVGVFPEGSIERPSRTMHAFAPGAAAIALIAHVPVVLCWISQPFSTRVVLLDSFLPRRRARVEVVEVVDLRAEGFRDADAATARLRRALLQRSRWADAATPATAPSPATDPSARA
jgi:1-acyl-sn-glycerol-3-phosphate acyltransferase